MATLQTVRVCRSARLTLPAYRFYRNLLLSFLADGTPPDWARLAGLARECGISLEATLALMVRQDLVQRSADGRIRAAYPFSGLPTVHRVMLRPPRESLPTESQSGQQSAVVSLYAMCALDALGIPLMLGQGAEVVSQDALRGGPVRVILRPTGDLRNESVSDPPHRARPTALGEWSAIWEPAQAVVYARSEEHEAEHDTGACVAAGTCCPLTNFFAHSANAAEWADRHGTADGHVLSQDEALSRAFALFAGVLDREPKAGPGVMTDEVQGGGLA